MFLNVYFVFSLVQEAHKAHKNKSQMTTQREVFNTDTMDSQLSIVTKEISTDQSAAKSDIIQLLLKAQHRYNKVSNFFLFLY